MYRGRRSPAATVLEQNGRAVSRFRELWWELQVAEAPFGLADLEGRASDRDDARHGRIPVEHGERSAVADDAKVFTEARLQIGNADVAHDLL